MPRGFERWPERGSVLPGEIALVLPLCSRDWPRKERLEPHPHIRAALRELEESKKELQTAAHDFGGHRVDAIRAIDEAEKQLRLALQYDRK